MRSIKSAEADEEVVGRGAGEALLENSLEEILEMFVTNFLLYKTILYVVNNNGILQRDNKKRLKSQYNVNIILLITTRQTIFLKNNTSQRGAHRGCLCPHR